jgi:subtilisin-like proprotein convertase family protein
LAFLVSASAFAAGPGIISESWTGAQIIPDNNASGVAFTFNITAPAQALITDVEVSLNLAGGWNGDLYAYLSHGSGFSVLLNRPGRTAGNLSGSGVSGLNLNLSDHYLTDVHTAANNPLTGNFAPDGRFVSPFTAVDTDARTAFLSSFTGLDPNGTWTIFFADVSPLAASTIQSWTVNLSVVPEPGSAALVGLAAAVCLVRRGWRSR